MKGIYTLLLLFAGALVNGENLRTEGERDLQSTLLLSTVLDDIIFPLLPGCGVNFTQFDTTITRDAQSSTITFDAEFTFGSSFFPYSDACELELPELNLTNPLNGESLLFPAQNVSLDGTVVTIAGYSISFESPAIGFIVPNNVTVPSFLECLGGISVVPSVPGPLGGVVASQFPAQICGQLQPFLEDLEEFVTDNEFVRTFPGRLPPSDIDTQIAIGTQKALGAFAAIFGVDNTFEPFNLVVAEETFERVKDSFFVAPAVSGLITNFELLQTAVEAIQENGAAALASADVPLAIFTAIPGIFEIVTGDDFFEVVISQEQLGQIVGIAFGLVGVQDTEIIAASTLQILEVLFGDIPVDTEEVITTIAAFAFDGLRSGDFLEFARANVTTIQELINDAQVAGIVPFVLDAFIQFQNDTDLEALLTNQFVNLLVPIDPTLVTLILFAQDVNQAGEADLQTVIFLNAPTVSAALNISVSSYFEFAQVASDVLAANDTLNALVDGVLGLSDQATQDLFVALGEIVLPIVDLVFFLLEPILDELFPGDYYYYYGDNFTFPPTDGYYYGDNFTFPPTDGYYYGDNFTFPPTGGEFNFTFPPTDGYYNGGYNYFDYIDYYLSLIAGLTTVGGLDDFLGSPFFTELFSIAAPDTSIFDFKDVLLETPMGFIKAAFSENDIVLGVIDIIESRFPPPNPPLIPPFDFVPFGIILEQFVEQAAPQSTSDFEFVLGDFIQGALFEILDFLATNALFASFDFPIGNFTGNFTDIDVDFTASNALFDLLGVQGDVLVFPEFLGFGSDLIVTDLTFAVNFTVGDFSRSGSAILFPTVDFTFGNFFFAAELQGQRLEIDSSLSVAAQQALLLFVDYTTIGNFGFGNITTLSDFFPVFEDFVECSTSTVAASVDAQNVIAQFEILSELLVGNLTEVLLLPSEYAFYAPFIDFPAETGDDLTEGAIEDIVAEFLFLYSPAVPTAIELAPKFLPQEFPVLLDPSGLDACARNPFFVPEIDDGDDDDDTDDDDGDDDDDGGDDEEVPIEILAGAGAAGVVAAAVAGYVAFSGGAAATAAAAGTGAAAAATPAAAAGAGKAAEGGAVAAAEQAAKADLVAGQSI